MNPASWFEIPANDLERARTFYQNILDIEMTVTEMGPSLMAWFPGGQGKPGAAGTLLKGEGYIPSLEGSVVYLSVADIEGTLAKIEANGGNVLMPKMSIGEYGFIAQFKDIEGNRVALHAVS